MKKGILHPFLYEYDLKQLGSQIVKVLYLPIKIYNIIRQEQIENDHQIDKDRNINMGGLSAMLGWAAPEIDLFKIARDQNQRNKKTLSFWAFNPNTDDALLKKQVIWALEQWLNCTLPKKKGEAKKTLKDHSKNFKWYSCEIDTSFTKGQTCIIPNNSDVFDLLTIIAARILEDQTLFKSEDFEWKLVTEGPSKTLYNGKTLLLYEPLEVTKGNRTGWYTEKFTVSALSSPEQSKLRIAVRVGVRNFIPISEKSLSSRKNRKADIFMLSDTHLAPGTARRRCLDLDILRDDFDIANKKKKGDFSYDRKVMEFIFSFSGISLDKGELETLGLNPLGGPDQNIWMLPRFGTNHKDKWAPGGTGIPIPERRTNLEFLDSVLERQGFKRVRFERKPNLRGKSYFQTIRKQQDLRIQTLKLLRRYGKSCLEIVLFHSRAESYELLKNAIIKEFGECDEATDGVFAYNEWCCPKCDTINEVMKVKSKKTLVCDNCESENKKSAVTGFGIKVIKLPVGPLGQRVERIDEEGISKLPKKVQNYEKRRLKKEKSNEALETITQYLKERLGEMVSPWCASVELDSKLEKKIDRDPYRLIYHAISSQGGVAQVVLFRSDQQEADEPEQEEVDGSENEPYKYQKCLLDLLRSIGVVPLFKPKPKSKTKTIKKKKKHNSRDGLRLAAWRIINTKGSHQWQPGQKKPILTPIYIQLDDEELSVSFLKDEDEIVRYPYNEALRKITLGEPYNLRSLKLRNDQVIKIERFFADVVPADQKLTVTFIDATNIRLYVRAFQNAGGLILDEIELGAVGGAAPYRKITLTDNISFVRVTDEKEKCPSYWVDGNVQGTTAGVFQEGNAKRTFWVSRGLPVALQTSSPSANKTSRKDDGSYNQFKNRRFPSITELFVHVNATDQNAQNLIGLSQTLFNAHLTTNAKDRTILPFPLHEAMLLKKAAK